MKSIRIAAIAVLATAAVSAFAQSDRGDRWEPAGQPSISTLSRAQVHAEAVKANYENFKRGYSGERGEFAFSAPVTLSDSGLTREAVRAETTKARGVQLLVDSAS